MAMILKADCNGGDAYAQKTISFPSHFFVQWDFMVPASTLATIVAAGPPNYFTADFGYFGDSLFATSTDGVTWRYWSDLDTGAASGTLTPDVWHTIAIEYQYLGSSLWQATYTLDGSALFSYTPAGASTLFATPGSLAVGGPQGGNHLAGEVYYIDNVKVGTTSGGTDLFTDDFESGTLAAWTSTTGAATVTTSTLAQASWQFLLCNLATDATLLDLTGYATATIVDKLSRPASVVLNIPYDVPNLFAAAADGDPNLHKGTRTIKVKRNSVLVKHVRVHNLSWDDDENIGNIQVTGYDPMQQLSVRTCWDSTGHVADFTYPSPTTGAAMLADVITNSVTYEDEVVGGSTPAPLPLDYTGGTISSTVNLAAAFTDTPITIGDLITTLSATGVLDVIVTPVDTSTGATAGIIGQLQVVDRWGSDLTGTVHFDYGTGSYNVAKARRVDGIDTLCNRLVYELGPKIETQTDVWKGNITGTELTPVNLSTPWQADQLASRVKYGTWAVFRIYDSGTENASRPLFHELWKTESTFRVYGRDQIFLTPARGTGAVFGPYADYQVGDTVAINTAAPLLGPAVSAQPQRIYGFQVEIDADGLEQVSEFIVSADGL